MEQPVREITQPTAPLADVIRDQIRRVHEARAGFDVLKAAAENRRKEFEHEHGELFRKLSQQVLLVEAEEATLRALAIKQYDITKDKDVGPGVGVRIEREVVIDRALAFAWAKTTGQGLELSERTVKQIAIATANDDGTCCVPGAVVKGVPKTTIAKDLGAALTKAAAVKQGSEAKP